MKLMIFRYMLFVLAAIFFLSSCTEELPTGFASGEKVLVPLSLSVLSLPSLPMSESADAAHSIYVIAFKKSAFSDELGTAQFAYASKAVQSADKIYVSLVKSKDEHDLYSLVVLANVSDEQIAKLSEGMTYSQVSGILYAASLQRFTSKTPVQMFGIINKGAGMQVQEGMKLGTISVTRAVSRVDIGVGTYDETTGAWNLSALDGPFTLTDIEVWSPMNRYYYIPAWGKFEYAADGTVEPVQASASLEYSATISTVWKYAATDISTNGSATYCKNVIYLPEAPLAGYTANQQTDRSKRTSIIIGGYYRDGSPEEEAKTWYRIDFTNAGINTPDTPLFDILRNHLYRFSLSMKARGAATARNAWEISGTSEQVSVHVGLVPWENGDVIDVTEDRSIRMNPDLSSLPEGVLMETDRNLLEISEAGGNIQVAFSSASPVELAGIDNGDSRLKITKGMVEEINGKMISHYLIQVAPQTPGQVAYSVSLNMKTALQQYSYDHFTVKVDPSGKVLPVVTLGGRTWMAFNSFGRGYNDQLYLDRDVTVDQMYQTRWKECLGNMFQFGRVEGYSPWTVPTGLTTRVPSGDWTGNRVPCPDGYRMPTLGELEALLPGGIKLPNHSSSYTYNYNGESVTARLVKAEPYGFDVPSAGWQNANYVTLTSNKTGTVMYIPFGGSKSAAEGDKPEYANPTASSGIIFWSQQRYISYKKGNGRQFELIDKVNKDKGWQSAQTTSYDHLNSLFYVRCIKQN